MQCCKCNTAMDKRTFEGILVDRCPTCEGVAWVFEGVIT